MKKQLISIALILVMAFGLLGGAALAATATPTSSSVVVNGVNVAFDAYNIDGNNYFKLRDLAFTLNGTAKQFNVGFDGASNAITLTSGQAYVSVGGEMTGKGAGSQNATPTTSKIFLDGREVQFTAYNIGGNNYFKLRDIGEAFNFGVDWDGSRNTIAIDTSKGYTPEGGGFTGNVTDQEHVLGPDNRTGRYTGALVNGKAEDPNGKFVYTDGRIYEGGFSDNMFNGQGTFTWTDGALYVGVWKDGTRNGRGKQTYASGNSYDGDWVQDVKVGQGTYTWTNGDEFVGEWADDFRNGQGTLSYADGCKYVGGWKDDKRDGNGTFYDAGGTATQQGQWREGAFIGGAGGFNGNVTNRMCILNAGSRGSYTGALVNGLAQDANGKLVYTNDSVYEGAFSGNSFNGQGKYTWASGAVYTGAWKDGERSGHGDMSFADGGSYTGEWSNDARHGQGTYNFADGREYTGGWADDVQSGQGTFTWADGRKYIGAWAAGKRDGYGTQYAADGTITQQGQWKENEFVG